MSPRHSNSAAMKFAVINYASSTTLHLDRAEPSARDCVTTQMTLDARGKGMTPAAGMCSSPREVNGRDFARVRLHGGCNAGNASACLFGSTLALHSIEFRAVRSVAALQ